MMCDFNQIIDYCLSNDFLVKIENFNQIDKDLLFANRNMILTVSGHGYEARFPITPFTSTDYIIEKVLCWMSSCVKKGDDGKGQ